MERNILAIQCGSPTDDWPQEAKTCGFALLRLTLKLTTSQVHSSIKPSLVLQIVSYFLRALSTACVCLSLGRLCGAVRECVQMPLGSPGRQSWVWFVLSPR